MLLHELSFVGDSLLEVKLESDLSYLLNFDDRVVYRNGRKTVDGKSSAYAFRSVEQLRYDFERDVAAIGGRLA